MNSLETLARDISGYPMAAAPISVQPQSRVGVPKQARRIHIGAETLGYFYQQEGGSPAGGVWVSAGRMKVTAGRVSLQVPDVYQGEGFQDQVMNISYGRLAIYALPEPIGFWFGTGVNSIKGDIGHQSSNERVPFEYVSLDLSLGFTYLIWILDIDLWGGFLFRVLGGQDPISIGNNSYEHAEVAPMLSLDFGFHF